MDLSKDTRVFKTFNRAALYSTIDYLLKKNLMLKLHNTLTGRKEIFTPLTEGKVSLYVCGPTVYDRIHLGNARSSVVFDMLYRVLQQLYPSVTYVRNITDVDDKINAAAAEKGISITQLTNQTISSFHEDIHALSVLPPTHEPRATEYISPMIQMIQNLLEKGYAYEAHGHVLFSVEDVPSYGSLSRMPLDQMKAGARVEVAPYKKSPLDFVLWKPSQKDSVGWESPWGYGRPGWHIECSAMSTQLLGPVFDIHGGGGDLMFPHHENERAQSCCLADITECARYWIHNGMLLVDGEKMSKSLGNFVTVHQALQQYHGEIIRWALLSSHYRHPLNWTPDLLTQATASVHYLYQALHKTGMENFTFERANKEHINKDVMAALQDDLNLPLALTFLKQKASQVLKDPAHKQAAQELQHTGNFMGFYTCSWEKWIRPRTQLSLTENDIQSLIQDRNDARQQKDYARADAIRNQLALNHIILEDKEDGATLWRHGLSSSSDEEGHS
jgi:cysteinyl-tRNA synthetase